MRDVKYRDRILFHLITGNDKFEARIISRLVVSITLILLKLYINLH